MFKVEIQFGNKTESLTFVDKASANQCAASLFEIFDCHEKWFDNERNTYIVTAHHLEISE